MSKIYCVYCGTENKEDVKECTKCKKELNPSEHLFKEYLYDHIKDDLKGKVTDSIFSLITNYIKSHLYGTFMSIALIFTITAGIISFADSRPNYIKRVSKEPTVDPNSGYGYGSSACEGECYTISLYAFADCCKDDENFLCGTPDVFLIEGGTKLSDNPEFMDFWLVNLNNNPEMSDWDRIFLYDDYMEYSKKYNEVKGSYDSCMNACGTGRWTDCHDKCGEQYDYNEVSLPKLLDFDMIVNSDISIVAQSGCGAEG